MKFLITQEEYDGLASDDLRALYGKSGSGYQLQVDGIDNHPDIEGLRLNRDSVLEEKKKLQAELDKIKKEGDDKHRKTLEDEKRWKELYEQEQAARQAEAEKLNERIAGLEKQTDSRLLDAEVTRLAAELSGDNAALIVPHIQKRLKVTAGDDGTRSLAVLDAAGNVSALSTDDLAKEFRAAEQFAPLLKGRESSGGGAGPTGNRNGGAADGDDAKWEPAFQKDTLNMTQQGVLLKQDPEAFHRLNKKHNPEFYAEGGVYNSINMKTGEGIITSGPNAAHNPLAGRASGGESE